MRKTRLIIHSRKTSIKEKNLFLKNWRSKLKNRVEAGKALQQIRDDKLYLDMGFKNFKEYCESVGMKYLSAY